MHLVNLTIKSTCSAALSNAKAMHASKLTNSSIYVCYEDATKGCRKSWRQRSSASSETCDWTCNIMELASSPHWSLQVEELAISLTDPTD